MIKKILLSIGVIASLFFAINSASAKDYHRLSFTANGIKHYTTYWVSVASNNNPYGNVTRIRNLNDLNRYLRFKANRSFYNHCKLTEVKTGTRRFSAICKRPYFKITNHKYRYNSKVIYRNGRIVSSHRIATGGYMAKG